MDSRGGGELDREKWFEVRVYGWDFVEIVNIL